MVGSTGNAAPFLQLIDTLQALHATAPIYFIAGDDDPAAIVSSAKSGPEALASWVLEAQTQGGIYLDAPIAQTVGKKTVWFVHEYLYDVEAAGRFSSLLHPKQA